MNVATKRNDRLNSDDFARLGSLIQQHCGIRMPEAKLTMMEGRLRRRVRALKLPTIEDYCRYLFDDDQLANELPALIDVITTNKTDFFREPAHFDHLMTQGLKHLGNLPHRPGRDRPLKIWSAACSVGAEPYTLAMVMRERARSDLHFRFQIYATDICTDVLTKARDAIYPEEMIAPVPPDLARRYFRRSRDRARPTVRLVPEIRQSVRFGHLNLMDDRYPMDEDMDVIFCRNILIYFDKNTQRSVADKLCRHLRPGGYLFVGHSETLVGMGLPLCQVATSTFIRS